MSEAYEYKAFGLIKILDSTLAVAGLMVVGSLVAQYGFFIGATWVHLLERFDFLFATFYLFQYLAKLGFSRRYKHFFQSHWFESIVALAILIELLILSFSADNAALSQFFSIRDIRSDFKIYILGVQILIVLSLMPGLGRFNNRIGHVRFHPAQVMLVSFFFVIMIGTSLLLLPKAAAPGITCSFIDAVFTATSAVCVTGLTVVDTGTYFSFLGQLIILGLIQLGGMGVVTLTTFLAMFFGKGVGVREQVVVNDLINLGNISAIGSMLRGIVIIVLSTELIGAGLLCWAWHAEGWSLGRLIYNSAFHSVSAFCNAGFSLFPTSLIAYRTHASVVFIIAALITIGGIGFNVITDLNVKAIRVFKTKRKQHLSVHTRLTLIVSFILVLTGILAYLLLESTHSRLGIKAELLSALFTSVTARTAGFNTIQINMLSTPFTVVLLMLMFIGASPCSTGGGIKTTTLAILWASIASIVSGRRRIVIFNKDIPFVVLNRALIIFTVTVMLIGLAVFFMTLAEPGTTLLDVLFEVISAFGTVGFSRDLTPNLHTGGKIVIALCMFFGRIGIITLAFAITAAHDKRLRVEYPQEMVVVG
jgi:potassium uptake TrkH family protein